MKELSIQLVMEPELILFDEPTQVSHAVAGRLTKPPITKFGPRPMKLRPQWCPKTSMRWANGTKIFLRQATMKFASFSHRPLADSLLKTEPTKIAQLFARFAEPARRESLLLFV